MFLLIGDCAYQTCYNLRIVLRIVKIFLDVIKWVIPLVLIVLGTIDLIKGVTSDDEKESSTVIKKFAKRVGFALVIFLIPLLVNVVMNLLSKAFPNETKDSMSWSRCWTDFDKKEATIFKGCEDIYKDTDAKTTGDSSQSSITDEKKNGDECKSGQVWCNISGTYMCVKEQICIDHNSDN